MCSAREIGSSSGSINTANFIPSPSRSVGGITNMVPFEFSSLNVFSMSCTLKPIEHAPALNARYAISTRSECVVADTLR